MIARLDLLLIGAGLLISVLGALLVDLWPIGVSPRSLMRREGAWGFVGLLILGGIVGFAGLLTPTLRAFQG
jgi:H+/Cl- antiporter ClcA